MGYLMLKFDSIMFDSNHCIIFKITLFIIICLYRVVWFQIFQSNTNNLQAIIWFQVTNKNSGQL